MTEYLGDEDVRFAVERNFIIIGEAVANLRRHEPDIGAKLENSGAVINFRNFIVHQYWSIDKKELWEIIERDLPELHTRVAGLLPDSAR